MCLYSELFWSVYSAFGLNMDRQGVSVCIQSELGKMWTTMTEYGHFSRSAGFSGSRFFRNRYFRVQVFQGTGFSGPSPVAEVALSNMYESLFCENGCIGKNGKNANFDKNEKCVLKNFPNFTGKRLCRNLSFNKVSNLRNATSLKKRLRRRYFLVNF